MLTPLSQEQNATAAVALLMYVDKTIFILFVKRVKNLKDPWSGQMALPGGKRDITDETLKDTVIRETAEEVGIDLNTCQILGVLPALQSVPRPSMKILPFVIFCERKPEIVLNKNELEAYVWISLEDLVRNKGTYTCGIGEFPAYLIGEYVVWGLTYRILQDFFRVLEGSGVNSETFLKELRKESP